MVRAARAQTSMLGLNEADATLPSATGPYVLGTSLATVVLMPSMSSSVASKADKKPDNRRHAELCTTQTKTTCLTVIR